MGDKEVLARSDEPGSHATHQAQGLGPSGFDPSRELLPPDDTDIRLIMQAALSRCPCCRGTPTTFMRFFSSSGIYQAYVHCSRCDMQVFKNARDKGEARDLAIAAWEKRPEWLLLSENTAWTDGRDVILLAYGMEVQAHFCPGEWSDDTPVSPAEYSGAVWSCFDDQFQIEIEEISNDPASWSHGQATHWRELTTRPRDSDRSGEADETRSGSALGESAGPTAIAQTEVYP